MEELFWEYELAEMADSPFWAPVVTTGQKSSTSDASPASAPPPAPISLPVSIEQEQGVHPPRSLDKGNI